MDTRNKLEVMPLLTSVPIVALTIFEMLLNIVNGFLVVYLFHRMRTTKMLHRNLRTMLLSLTVALGLFNLTTLWKGIMFFLLNFYDTLMKIQLIYNAQQWVIRIVYDSALNVFAITMTGLSVERIVATVAVQTYEAKESKSFAVGMVVIQWSASVGVSTFLTVYDLLNTGLWSSTELQLSASIVFTRPTILMIMFIVGVIGFFAFAMVLFRLYFYNRTHYQKFDVLSLAARYQLAENVATIRLLLPIVLLFGILYATSLCVTVFIVRVSKGQILTMKLVREIWLFERFFNIPGSLYTSLFCVCCLVLHVPLRTTLLEDFKILKKRPLPTKSVEGQRVMGVRGQKMNFENEGDIYFKTLQGGWQK